MFFEDVCEEVKNAISGNDDFRIDMEKEESLDIFYDDNEQLISLISKDEDSIIVVFKNVATSMEDGQKILAVRDGEEINTDFEEFTFLVNEHLGLIFTLDINEDNKLHFIEDFISISKSAFDGLNQASLAADNAEDQTNMQQGEESVKERDDREGEVKANNSLEPLEVVKSYLGQKGFNYKEIKSDLIVAGFKSDNYIDSDGDRSIRIYYETINNGSLFRVEVPKLYEIYDTKVNSVEERLSDISWHA